jgi:hypothetical protein
VTLTVESGVDVSTPPSQPTTALGISFVMVGVGTLLFLLGGIFLLFKEPATKSKGTVVVYE